jgi:hypothetical protein
MPKLIYKYPMPVVGRITLHLPYNSRPLHLGVQGDDIHLWLEIDNASTSKHNYDFLCVFTGRVFDLPTDAMHVGTIQVGPVVSHCYWLNPKD